GRSGSSRKRPRASSSACRSLPATDRSNSATPTVEAWARWTEPKASWTKRSCPAANWLAVTGSLAVSPDRKRVFSNTVIPPGAGVSNSTATSVSSAIRSATGRSVNAGSIPLGRPRCEQTVTPAPRRTSSSSVGSAWRIRKSSDTRPSSSGTFRSDRTRTDSPSTSTSSMVRYLPMSLHTLGEPLQYCPHLHGIVSRPLRILIGHVGPDDAPTELGRRLGVEVDAVQPGGHDELAIVDDHHTRALDPALAAQGGEAGGPGPTHRPPVLSDQVEDEHPPGR